MYMTPMKGRRVARLFLSKYWISWICLAIDSMLSWMSPPDLLASDTSMAVRLDSMVPVRSAKNCSALSSGTRKLILAISFFISLVRGVVSLCGDLYGPCQGHSAAACVCNVPDQVGYVVVDGVSLLRLEQVHDCWWDEA